MYLKIEGDLCGWKYDRDLCQGCGQVLSLVYQKYDGHGKSHNVRSGPCQTCYADMLEAMCKKIDPSWDMSVEHTDDEVSATLGKVYGLERWTPEEYNR